MALDPNIALQAKGGVAPLDLMSSLRRGLEAKQAIKMAPILEEIQKSKLQQIQQAQQMQRDRFIGTPQRVTKDGKDFLVGLVQDSSGAIRLSETPVAGEFVSPLGETAKEEEARRIREAQRKADIGVKASGEKVSAVGGKERLQAAIDTGLDATDNVADIGRALELLNEVGTGRPEALLLKSKELLGIESADELELKTNLGRAVIANLRTSFGGNPTEGERAALAEIETSFTQQGEVNRRLLNKTLNKLERRIDRGVSAAKREGDDFSLERLEEVKSNILSLRKIGLADPGKKEESSASRGFDLEYDPATGTFK